MKGTGGLSSLSMRRRWLLQSLAWAGLAGCGRQASDDIQPATPLVPHAGSARAPDSLDVVGHGIILPGLIDESGHGPMMRLVQAVWASQPGVRLHLEALPLERVVDNVINGVADFGFPSLPGERPYRWSTRAMGRVCFVLYSRQGDPVTRERIEALRGVHPFPLDIEAPDMAFGFPTRRFTSLASALAKVSAGRLDALLWAQEEADAQLRALGLPNLMRSSYGLFDDVLMLPDGPRGRWIDQVWSKGVAELTASGRMESLYERVHRPFDPWQPGSPGGRSHPWGRPLQPSVAPPT